MKIWLDDVRPRPDDSWTHCYSAGEAIMQMGLNEVEEASLDHDLGPGDGTGMDVVEWIVKTRRWPLKKPRVHSANFHAAKDMQALIDRAGPYRDGIRAFIRPPLSPPLHPVIYNQKTPDGTHMLCPDVACCRCACPGCMYEWKAAGKPTESDCEIHIR